MKIKFSLSPPQIRKSLTPKRVRGNLQDQTWGKKGKGREVCEVFKNNTYKRGGGRKGELRAIQNRRIRFNGKRQSLHV